MKKILSLVLVAIMLLSTLVLTSCDESTMQMVQSILEENGLVAPKEVRTTVTEEEWNAVLKATNFTIIDTLTIEGENIKRTVKKTDLGIEITYADQLVYHIMVEGKNHMILQHNGEWEKQPSISTPLIKDITVYDLFPMSGWSELYQKLEYDEERKCYFAVEGDDTAEFYFEDGQIVYGNLNGYCEFKDFGKTVVEVPDFSHLFTENE